LFSAPKFRRTEQKCTEKSLDHLYRQKMREGHLAANDYWLDSSAALLAVH
jgi:hypothetical protein